MLFPVHSFSQSHTIIVTTPSPLTQQRSSQLLKHNHLCYSCLSLIFLFDKLSLLSVSHDIENNQILFFA